MIIKHILSFILLFTSIVQAQKSDEIDKKKWSIGIAINSVEPITEAGYDAFVGQIRLFDPADHKKSTSMSFGLNFSRNINETVSCRFLIKRTSFKISEIYDQRDVVPNYSTDYILDSGYAKQSEFVLSPCLIWKLNWKKIQLFSGFQLAYKQYSPLNINLKYYDYDVQTNNLLSRIDFEFRTEGGFSIGLGPVAGFSIAIFKGLCIGSEFSSAFSYYKTGGKLTQTKVVVFPSSTRDESSVEATYEGYKFSSIISSINLSFTF
jgi:hypothetical protein